MKKFGYVGYNPSLRMFAFFRDKVYDNGERILPYKLIVVHSFGCSQPSCNFKGFCKDCPSKLVDQVTY